MRFYDWNRTLAYDAPFTMVVGGRGIGKTYGLRKQCIRDYIKHKHRFVEVVRHAEQLKSADRIQNGYFDKLELDADFEKYIFKVEGTRCFIALKCENEKDAKWECIGYFVALTQANKIKQRTFSQVKRIIMDEGVIDELLSQYQRYLIGEFDLLMNVVSTVTRETSDSKVKPKIYILGNAVSLVNPYFAAMGVHDEPKRGYSWHNHKKMLLHYVDAEEYADIAEGTLAQSLAVGDSATANYKNAFITHDKGLFAKKPARAKFEFGVVFKKQRFGVWLDMSEGYYYIDEKIPKGETLVYSLVTEDESTNYIAAKRMQKQLKGFVELYYLGVVRYINEDVRTRFLHAMKLFGVR